MRLLKLLTLILILAPASAHADVAGADFDNQPLGPYAGPGRILAGDPSRVQIVPANEPGGGAPIPGDGLGNMLCIDTRNSGTIIIEFDFWCDASVPGTCQLKYSFSGAAWSLDSGWEVHVDADGVYDNPDDVWEPLIGLPPSTTQGSNTENEGDCEDANVHTVTFIVNPNTVMYIDDMSAECLENTVPNQEHSWGALKSTFDS